MQGEQLARKRTGWLTTSPEVAKTVGVLCRNSKLPEEQRLGLSFWDLLHCIVDMEPPVLPAAVKGVSFAPPFTAFVSACLAKDQTARPSAEALLAHPWLTESQPHLVDISTWLKKTHEDDEDALASPPEKA